MALGLCSSEFETGIPWSFLDGQLSAGYAVSKVAIQDDYQLARPLVEMVA